MTTGEFDTLMQIVYSRWNAKSYPDAVKRRIWFFVHELPQKSFEKIIYTLLDTQRAAPMPSEFKMLAYAEKDRLGLRTAKEPETKPPELAKCWDCGDSGNLFVIRKSVHGPWAKWPFGTLRCHCEAGQARPSAQGPVWNEAVARSYDKRPLYSKDAPRFRPNDQESAIETFQLLLGQPSTQERKGELKSFGEHSRIGSTPEGSGGKP